jgi:beta-lactamase regulating signal transducer with metallopeptidase domain
MNTDWITGAWLPMFVNVCLQATLILCLAMIAIATFRRRSAAFRHHIAATALAGLLLLPLLILIPTVKFALPVHRHIPTASSYASDRQRTNSPQPPITIPNSGTTIVAAPIHRDSLSTETATSYSTRRPGREPIHVANSRQALAFNPPPSLYVLLFAIWTMGVTLLLARFLVGSLRLVILARRCPRVTDATLCADARSVEQSAGIRQRITLIQYNALTPIAVPVTWGLWRPVILIPHDASNWSRERLHAVLLHEVAHIRRGDWAAQRLAQLACALFWFHPLAWYLEYRMQHDAERACDDAVLASGIGATEYAGHLLDLVRAIRANNAPAAAVSMARDSQVSARLQAILDARPRTTSTRRALIAATVIAIAILGSTALLRPLAAQSTAPPAQDAGAAPKYVRPIQVGFQAPAPPGGPSGQKITLANGTGVELIAVGSSPDAGGDDWWRPNGVPLIEAPVRTNNRFHNSYWGVGTRFLSRSFFFRFSSPTDTTASTTGYVVDPEGKLASDGLHYGRDMRLNNTHLRSSEPATGTVLQGFPIHETHCTYRIGVATGPWETVGVIRFPLSPAPRVRGSVAGTRTYNPVISVNDTTPALSYQDSQGKDHKQSLLGSHAPLGDVARRVIALDQFGMEIPLDNEAIEYMELTSSTVSRIAELRLETRPYQWAEFKDIELQPKRGPGPAPIATPAALPGFRHRFANGLTVSVLGVTERKKEGGRWWQPDGNRLAGPVTEFVSSLSIDQRLPNRPRAILLKLSSSRDITYSYAQRFSPEPTFGRGMVHITNDAGALKDQPTTSWTLVSYPPEIRSSTFSLGIASGAWQTVSSLPMPRDVRHKNVGPDSFDGDVTCSLGDRPSMTYDAQNGERRNIAFLQSARSLSNVARRIVGIDKTGTVVPLTTALTGNPETGDLIVLTFADSGALKRYNRFDLSTIKEFRLQTRPYEWAEFKGIKLEPQR